MSGHDWTPLVDIDDEPASDVFRALLWGRLHISSNLSGQKWVTDWKVLKAAWVRGTHRFPTSAKRADSWFHTSDCGLRIDWIEATHFQLLPDAPEGWVDPNA